jgi:tetratricopeptide (TPR) repeat protein
VQKLTGGVSVADTLRDARVALRSAWYDAALELLDGCEDWAPELAEEAIVIKAETILRRDPVGAVAYLTTVEDIPTSPSGQFKFALMYGQAHATVRDWSSAESRYAEARTLASSIEHGLELMAAHDLRLKFFKRELEPGSPEAALAVTHPDPTVASIAYAHRAWLYAWLGHYEAHITDLRRAVSYATVPTAEPVDVAALAVSTHALAQVSFETANEEGILAAREAAEAIAWTPDVRSAQFATVRAFGWDAFLRGRAGEAQWTFKDARALAPGAEWQVLVHLDRAYVARISRNEVWAIEELAEADRLARDIRWESAYDESRQILVTLAVLHAPVDAVRAQRYAATYSRIGSENVAPMWACSTDRRAFAHAKYAQGKIDQTLGRKDAAVASLLQAYEIFDSASYHYRSALTASALAEVTGEDRWREKAMQHAQRYPDCPLASVVESAVSRESAMPAELTPLQRQIARALWSGADSTDLSQRFSRSLYTIERQIAAVFTAFGVASRGALLEEARSRGLA